MIFLEPIAKGILALHGLITLGTLVFLILSLVYYYKKDYPLGNKFTLWACLGYLLTFISGLLIYPVYEVKVSVEDFVINRPWAAGLFEIKELISALGLFAALALFVLSLVFLKMKEEKEVKKLYLSLIYLILLIFLFKAVVGFFLRGLHSV